jgi:hypothetical protein
VRAASFTVALPSPLKGRRRNRPAIAAFHADLAAWLSTIVRAIEFAEIA